MQNLKPAYITRKGQRQKFALLLVILLTFSAAIAYNVPKYRRALTAFAFAIAIIYVRHRFFPAPSANQSVAARVFGKNGPKIAKNE